MCLTIHIAAALHLLFSACTLDVTSTVMTRMHVRSSMRAHSPLSGSSVNEGCAQDTEQEHGKHGSGTLLSSFPLVGTSVRLVGLRVWSEREARRNECETRCWLSFGTSKELVAGGDCKVADCPWLLVVTRSHNPEHIP